MGSRTWQLEGGGLALTSGCRTPGMDSVGLSHPDCPTVAPSASQGRKCPYWLTGAGCAGAGSQLLVPVRRAVGGCAPLRAGVPDSRTRSCCSQLGRLPEQRR